MEKTPDVGLVSKLSCVNCRHRKVKCGRDLPKCQRCVAQGLKCEYRARRPRASKKAPAAAASVPSEAQGALVEIPNRLRRVEERTANSDSRQGDSATPQPSSVAQDDTCRACGRSGPKPGLLDTQLLDSNSPQNHPPFSAAKVLASAVSQVRSLRSRRCANVVDIVNQTISIPPESAKRWMANAFNQVHGRLFPSFLDRKLIDMLPDLMGGPNVKIDASIVLIYYCLLWQGSFFRGPGTFSNADIAYTRQLFICCLRTIPVWYAEATGTIADFVAAIFMAQTARENMEDNLSWEMHKRACEYAHVLDLHNMDNAERELSSPYVLTDDDRVAMWDLIQVDVFQRLANNRSAAFAADLTKWRINMPWLSTDVLDEAQALEDEDQAISTMFFLARSRITFALLGFFEALETMDSAVSHPLRIAEPFCQEIFTTFAEWKLDDWIFNRGVKDASLWLLGDLSLAGHTCILLMLRRTTLPFDQGLTPELGETPDLDGAIPQTAQATKASRCIMQVLCYLLNSNLPTYEMMSFALGAYSVHLAFGQLASGIIEGADAAEPQDLFLLQRTLACIERTAKENRDFMPLTHGMTSIVAEARKKLASRVAE